ncbi:MAG: hypothetical protein GWP19_04790 [Planctomycetia bacterium]|nr:hypothetical protein [Planctomycetia bacterium]
MIFRKAKIYLLCISIQFIVVSCDLYYDPVPSHSIQITRPYAGAEIKVGEYLKIRWEDRDVGDSVRLDLYNNGSYVNTIISSTPNNYEYLWQPSSKLKHSENYQIKITDLLDSSIFALSDEFLIYKTVIFPDENLNTVILNIFGNPYEITTKDLVNLTSLNARSKNIWNIKGLNNCVNLVELYISHNNIYVISDISDLINLETLVVSGNPIVDLSPINFLEKLKQLEIADLELINLSFFSNLQNLTRIVASNNQIADLSGIRDMSEIKNLMLDENMISDLSDIEKLDSLEFINLGNNQISNISILSSLPNLQIVLLHWNQIADIEPLVLNPGINSGDIVILTGNPLNDISINNYIPDLIARGVSVTY